MGASVEGIKYAGGSFALMPPEAVEEGFNKTAHDHDVYVSTGGWIENVLRFGREAVERYIEEAKLLGFDVVEISGRLLSLPTDSMLRLVTMVKKAAESRSRNLGFSRHRRPTSAAELEAEGTKDVGWLIAQGGRLLDAGADILMIESEGITESVQTSRTGVAAAIIDKLGLDKVMFEAADPPVFEWLCQELWQRGQSFCRPQPDRAARGRAAVRYMGHEEQLGPHTKILPTDFSHSAAPWRMRRASRSQCEFACNQFNAD